MLPILSRLAVLGRELSVEYFWRVSKYQHPTGIFCHGSVPFFPSTFSSSSVSIVKERSLSLRSVITARKKAKSISVSSVAPLVMASVEPNDQDSWLPLNQRKNLLYDVTGTARCIKAIQQES